MTTSGLQYAPIKLNTPGADSSPSPSRAPVIQVTNLALTTHVDDVVYVTTVFGHQMDVYVIAGCSLQLQGGVVCEKQVRCVLERSADCLEHGMCTMLVWQADTMLPITLDNCASSMQHVDVAHMS